MLDAERERVHLINQEWENLKEAREMAEKKVQQLQDRLRAVRSQAKKRGNDLNIHSCNQVIVNASTR